MIVVDAKESEEIREKTNPNTEAQQVLLKTKMNEGNNKLWWTLSVGIDTRQMVCNYNL